MAILPLNIARVSNTLRMNIATQNLASTQQSLLEVQNELATGQRINTPSDDPAGAALSMQLQKILDQQGTYKSNINQALGQLGQADSAFSDTNGGAGALLQQAISIASKDVGSDTSDVARQNDAQLIQGILNQMLTLSNTQYEGNYIFAGTRADQPAFVQANGGVQFAGSAQVQTNLYDDNTVLPFGIDGSQVFGATATVNGTADLTPAASAATRLSDLRGANTNGVAPGTIQISDGTTTKTIDLSKADTLGDVVNAINAAGVGSVTASVTNQGLTLTGTPAENITVNDIANGTTASDLGIQNSAGAGAGNPLVGSAINPNLTLLTPLSSLKSGAGIDLANGFTISNGQKTVAINTSNLHSVQDLINAINNSGTGAQAQINAAHTGIDIINSVSGSQLTISENGGTTATDLGIRTFSPTTLLSQLNNGKGVQFVSPGPDFQITKSDGRSFSVSLYGSKTVQDVINAINTAAGSGVTASFSTTGNRIVLTDTVGGPGTLTITPQNFSTAAAQLGLSNNASGNVITGTDVNPIAPQGIFANLQNLLKALQTNNQSAITSAGAALQNDASRISVMQGKVGAMEQDLNSRLDRLDGQNTTTQSLLSNVMDVDYTEAISRFQTLQTTLQAALQSTGRMLNQSLLDFLQ